MIKYKTKKIPARTTEAIETISCDMCGRVYKNSVAWTNAINWPGTTHNAVLTGVFIRRESEVDGDVECQYHICPDCFELKLAVAQATMYQTNDELMDPEIRKVLEELRQKIIELLAEIGSQPPEPECGEIWKTGEERLAEL